jgi:hypothetical protein
MIWSASPGRCSWRARCGPCWFPFSSDAQTLERSAGAASGYTSRFWQNGAPLPEPGVAWPLTMPCQRTGPLRIVGIVTCPSSTGQGHHGPEPTTTGSHRRWHTVTHGHRPKDKSKGTLHLRNGMLFPFTHYPLSTTGIPVMALLEKLWQCSARGWQTTSRVDRSFAPSREGRLTTPPSRPNEQVKLRCGPQVAPFRFPPQ